MSTNFCTTIAQIGGERLGVPYIYQAIAVVTFALFLLSFSVFRKSRSWRRLFQAYFTKKSNFSVNRNKQIDEQLKKYSIIVAMTFLVICAASLIVGATQQIRNSIREPSKEEKILRNDIQRARGY